MPIIYIFSLYCPSEFQNHISNCPPDISTWMSQRNLRPEVAKTNCIHFLFIAPLPSILPPTLLDFILFQCHGSQWKISPSNPLLKSKFRQSSLYLLLNFSADPSQFLVSFISWISPSFFTFLSLHWHHLRYYNNLLIALTGFTLTTSGLFFMLHPEYLFVCLLKHKLDFPTCLRLFISFSIKKKFFNVICKAIYRLTTTTTLLYYNSIFLAFCISGTPTC